MILPRERTLMQEHAVSVKPRLRGVFHQWACLAAVPLGVLLVLGASGSRARVVSLRPADNTTDQCVVAKTGDRRRS